MDIFKDIPANCLTPNIMNYFAEAAVVCLTHQEHDTGVLLKIRGEKINEQLPLCWDIEISPQARDSWNDLQDATEDGASYLAIIIVHHFTPLKVIERARKRTGFDYWLGEKADETYPFQKKAKLEISGILQKDGNNSVKKRLNQKLSQVRQHRNSRLPAYVVVVEFSEPFSEVATDE